MSRRRWTIAGSASRPMTWPATVISATPSAATIPAFAPMSCAHRAANVRRPRSGAKSSRAQGLRSPKRSTIPTASLTRSTIAAYATSLPAIARPPSRRRSARAALARKIRAVAVAREQLGAHGLGHRGRLGRRRRRATDRCRNRQRDGRRSAAAILSGPGGRSSAGRRPAGRRPRVISIARSPAIDEPGRRFLSAGNLSPARRMPAGARPRQQG